MQKTNIKNRYFSKLLAAAGLLVILASSLAGPLSAQSVNQGYTSDQDLQNGMLVRQKDGDPGKVETVSYERIRDLKGVVVSKNDSPVVLASEGQDVFVADRGRHTVLVSNENGPIKPGDYLSVSSVNGIAMKVNDTEPIVLGRATSAFNATDDVISTATSKSDNKKLKLGRVQTDIGIGPNPFIKKASTQVVPKILKDISGSVSGKPVSNARIWLASVIFVTASIVTGVMLYSGAKNSLLALGRNPLSKASILRGLLQVVMLSLIVFISGIFGVYLLLKL